LDKVIASHPDPENDVRAAAALSAIYEALTRVHLRNGESDQARAASAIRLELWQNWNRKLPNRVFIQQQLASASVP
jgi:hypothetical protein